MEAGTRAEWAPDACPLSPAERLARAEEFGQMFTETVRKAERLEPARLSLELAPGTGRSARYGAIEVLPIMVLPGMQ